MTATGVFVWVRVPKAAFAVSADQETAPAALHNHE
jgi:hypothetical protein